MKIKPNTPSKDLEDLADKAVKKCLSIGADFNKGLEGNTDAPRQNFDSMMKIRVKI